VAELKPDDKTVWVRKGNTLRELERDEEGVAAYDQALTLDPGYADAAFGLAAALYRIKRFEEAVAAYERAQELAPKNKDISFWKGNALLSLNRAADALAAYEHAEMLGRNDYAVHLNSSRALSQLDRQAEALVEINHALDLEPDYYGALCDRAALYCALNRHADALATYERILELKPEDRGARLRRGHELYHLKRYDEALAAYDAALAAAPEDRDALRWKAGTLEQLGRFENALAAYNAALAVAPEDHEISEALDTLAQRLAWNIPDQKLTLPDKRTLGYLDFGDPNGYPIFYFHGLPGSRLELMIYEQLFKELHIRLIAPDRPGLGLSSYQRFRTIRKWPKDVAALADHLGIKRFAVLGVSGGGPYAAVCAYTLPEQVAALGLASSMAPPAAFKGKFEWTPTNTSLWFWRNMPIFALTLPVAALSAWAMRRSPESFMGVARFRDRDISGRRIRNLCEFIKAVLEERASDDDDIHLAPLDRARIIEPYRQGGRGVARESWLVAHNWGFRLERIAVPTRLWHGKADKVAPIALGHYLAEHIPNCQATYYSHERHGALTAHPREIFTALLAAACARSVTTSSPTNIVAESATETPTA
jgi:pimeloyl-ACP methyl ester carboxylesterase/Flp pilus assembly protein TadD